MSEVLNLAFLYRVHNCNMAMLQFSYFARKAKLVCSYNATNTKYFFTEIHTLEVVAEKTNTYSPMSIITVIIEYEFCLTF